MRQTRYWVRPVLILCFLFFRLPSVQAQLPTQWHGTWAGTMHIYRQQALVDSVPVRLTIKPSDKPGVLTWRTDYLSPKQPMTKDYTLVTKDAAKGIYITDEGGGTVLTNYLFGNKLFNVFEVQGILLTATYELRGNELIFEVTSGKKLADPANGVSSYAVDNLQRVVFRK
ncbi:hypothetical protein [Spirosoma sordidisoli]|uniref:hypothetical protein n=1 Tax=Spirosoma sordidisoli TaxID=2502893 RepID=UPI0019D293FE|nr:hypothetical protein [Spirosoma sordidisoli]